MSGRAIRSWEALRTTCFDERRLQFNRRCSERTKYAASRSRLIRLRTVAVVIVIVISAARPPCIAQGPALRPFDSDGRAAVNDFAVRPVPGGGMEVAAPLSRAVSIQIERPISVEQADTLLHGTDLETLRLRHKSITDDHLRRLPDGQRLSTLDLRGTSVTGRLLARLVKVGDPPNTRLRSLDLDDTFVADEHLAHLKACPLLRVLSPRNTAVTDECLQYLESLDFLEELDLGQTKITLDGVARLARIRTLRVLQLPVGLGADEVAERLVDLSQLEKLHGAERFSDEGLRSLGRLPNLKSLSVWDSPRLTGKGLSYLSGLSCLTHLELVRCGIQDDDLTHLKSLPSLRSLYVADCRRLTDDALVHIGTLTRLRSLTLEDLSITDRGAANLKNLTDLEVLGMRGTPIGDDAMESIAGLENLRMLDLDATNVKSAGLYRLSRLRRLQRLVAAAFEQDEQLRAELLKTLKYVQVGDIMF